MNRTPVDTYTLDQLMKLNQALENQRRVLEAAIKDLKQDLAEFKRDWQKGN